MVRREMRRRPFPYFWAVKHAASPWNGRESWERGAVRPRARERF